MKKLIFVTGNAGKLSEAQALMPGAEVRGVPMDFDEPRSNDLTYIARKKAEQAKKWIESPFFVQDAGFYIPTLNGFPGSYVNFALKTIGVEGILKLMEGKEDRSCAFRQCLVYWDGQKESIFTCENPGRIAEAYAGRDRSEQWSGLWHIFIPEGGERTLSEYTDEMLRQRRKNGSGTILQLARFLKVEE